MLTTNREKSDSTDISSYLKIFNTPDSSGVFGRFQYMSYEDRESRTVTNLQNKRLLESLNPYTKNHQYIEETIPSDPKVRKDLFPLIIDREYIKLEISQKERFISDLRLAFEGDPVEDGVVHPAEKIIGEALYSVNRQSVYQWLSELSLDVDHPDMASSVLRCLGRRKLGPISWCVKLVKSALTTDDVEIRDAAVQAMESWGKVEFCNVLKNHSEDVHWLHDYIHDVIYDLKKSE